MSSTPFSVSIRFLVVSLGDAINQWYSACRNGSTDLILQREKDVRLIYRELRGRVGDGGVNIRDYRPVCSAVAAGTIDPVHGALDVLRYVDIFMSGVLE